MFILAIVAAAIANSAATPQALSDQWAEAREETQGFSLCYPAGRLRLMKSTTKTDALEFQARDGARLKYWSREYSTDRFLSAASKDLDEEVKREGGKFIYNSRGGSILAPWDYTEIVFGGKTHYNVMRRSGVRVLYMRLSVPNRLSDEYAPIADRLAGCFKPILQPG